MPKARVFNDAASQYLWTSSPPRTGAPLSFSCWMKSDDATVNQTLGSFGQSTSDTVSYLLSGARGADAGDPIRAQMRQGANTYVADSIGYSVNTWHHVALVHQFITNPTATIYVDGANKVTATSGIGSAMAAFDRFAIGTLLRTGTTLFMSGSIALPAVWNNALSDQDVADLYNGGTAVVPTTVQTANCIAYWPFEDNDLDGVGSFNLTAVGSPTFGDGPPMAGPIGPPRGSLMLMGVGR